ncbi:MAG: ABC transporter permease [Vicinamibacterales bacterium]
MIRGVIICVQIGLRALGRNRLRTGLTMLGVIIGVAAVIAMVALGNGARGSMERTLKSAGTNIVEVSAGNYIRGGESMNIATGRGSATTLSREDAAAIGALDNVQAVSANLRERAWIEASDDARFFTLVLGSEPSLADIHGWTWLNGENFTPEDVQQGNAVITLGRVASASLFGEGVDPTGRTVRIHDQPFRVVGVMRAVDKDQDEGAYVPVTALQALTERPFLQTITVGVVEAGVATTVSDAITLLLRDRHGLTQTAAAEGGRPVFTSGLPSGRGGAGGMTPDDFVVRTLAAQQITRGLYTEVAAFALANMPKLDQATMEEMGGTLARAGTTMTALLASIAAISLVVGGIGIMNIMLVSVTERTKEIGLRLAVGARRRDVMVQFLIEALTLSLIGGTIGVLAGMAAAEGLTVLLEWPTEVSPSAIALAFLISAAVGIGFGYYPARRASRLDPIDALRYE